MSLRSRPKQRVLAALPRTHFLPAGAKKNKEVSLLWQNRTTVEADPFDLSLAKVGRWDGAASEITAENEGYLIALAL